MKFILFGFVIFLFTLSHADSGMACLAFYSQSNFTRNPNRLTEIARQIHEYRMKEIRPASLKELVVDNVKYDILGILGRSGSINFLARNPGGILVQIKYMENDGAWINSVFYEMAATEYHLEQGSRVSRILSSEIQFEIKDGIKIVKKAILVKEYFEGIRGVEMSYYKPFSKDVQKHLDLTMTEEIRKMRANHKGFKVWLERKGIDLQQYPFSSLEKLLEYGDANESNVLYSAQVNDWILFDP